MPPDCNWRSLRAYTLPHNDHSFCTTPRVSYFPLPVGEIRRSVTYDQSERFSEQERVASHLHRMNLRRVSAFEDAPAQGYDHPSIHE